MTATHSSTLAAEVPEFAQLQRQIHDALLAQNPEWILANGESPTCDSYDARFAQLLRQLSREATGGGKQGSTRNSERKLQYA